MTDASNEAAEAAQTEAEKPKAKAKHKPVIAAADDVLVQIVQDISKLDAATAIAAVPALLDGADENYFRLGGVLSAISANKFYETKGYDTFKSFVEHEYNIQYRKAMYWIQIYDNLIESSVPWNKVKDIGWTKLKELSGILTLDNVDEWVQRAKNSTTLQLIEAINLAKSGSLEKSGIEPVDEHKSEVTTFTVKVHADQKTLIREAIDKAKQEAQTDYDGVALEAICMNYMSGGNVGKPAALETMLAKFTPEDVLLALEKAFPSLEIVAKVKSEKKKAS